MNLVMKIIKDDIPQISEQYSPELKNFIKYR